MWGTRRLEAYATYFPYDAKLYAGEPVGLLFVHLNAQNFFYNALMFNAGKALIEALKRKRKAFVI